MRLHIFKCVLILILIFFTFYPHESYAYNRTLINQIKHNLNQKQYQLALNRANKLLSSSDEKDKQYGWYYYVLTVLQWDKPKELPSEESFEKLKKYYQLLKKVDGKTLLVKKEEKEKVIELYERMFKPVLMIIEVESKKDYEPVGIFRFRFTTTEKNKNELLRPIQEKRYEELGKTDYKKIEFKQKKDNYFAYTIPDVPVLQSPNEEVGYSIAFRQKGMRNGKMIENRQKSLDPFILPCNLAYLDKTLAVKLDVDQELLQPKLPPGYVLLDFRHTLPLLDISQLDVINRDTYKQDGYLILNVNDADRLEIRVKDNTIQKSLNKTITLPVAVGAIALILFIVIR